MTQRPAPKLCGLPQKLALAGICIEDMMFPSVDAYDFDLAVERIRAAASAARALPQDFVLTARADGVMTNALRHRRGPATPARL